MALRLTIVATFVLVASFFKLALADPAYINIQPQQTKPLILAHYLPWFEADPTHETWGWHWTMLHFKPDRIVNGKPEIASHYEPLIGPYDSDDTHVLECQAQLMKLAGIDGAVIDWMGTSNDVDYPLNLRNAQHFAAILQKANMKFCANYEEDVTLNRLTKDGTITQDNAISQVESEMKWLEEHWFVSPEYVRLGDSPVLLTFGGGYLSGAQWIQVIHEMNTSPALFSENTRRSGAIGAFAWVEPKGGTSGAFSALDQFYSNSIRMPFFVAAAFPGFHDIYREAGAGESFGYVDDDHGKTYQHTLSQALTSGALVVQIVTWNDWGEGTMIEPSVERGYRDLETTQRLRRKYIDPNFPYIASDLRLPIKLYELRERFKDDTSASAKLDEASDAILSGHLDRAEAIIAELSR